MPILTHLIPWSDNLIAEAIHRELDRGGQAFFLHNRVETIYQAADRVRRLVPEARAEVAHGQMTPRELDRVMTAFVDGTVDVLVCSSIIENGLDVPNANTLIVDRADRFGLSQLYQIRGRVGRSDRRAYCYLVVPPHLNEDAERRLRVLEHYTELGSGYSVALRDLELRGAGNLLGADQSGFANSVGIDAYLRLLERTVTRLQEDGGPAEHPKPF
jgi:transcription-repair coupling factor (superfamily II helicase)